MIFNPVSKIVVIIDPSRFDLMMVFAATSVQKIWPCLYRKPTKSRHNTQMYTWTINEPHLPKDIRLDVMQSHPLRRTHFDQYQASSAALGDQEMGTAILCTKCSQVVGLIHIHAAYCLVHIHPYANNKNHILRFARSCMDMWTLCKVSNTVRNSFSSHLQCKYIGWLWGIII